MNTWLPLRAALVWLLVLGIAPPAAAQHRGSSLAADTAAAARISRFIEDERAHWDAPAISAAVAVGNRVVYSAGVGLADIEGGVPATATTVYRIASTSKVITATAVLQLVERGAVGLEDDIRDYVPEFPQKKWPITVRQVLTHTSGIRHYNRGETSRKTEHYASVVQAIALFKDDPLLFEPGTRYGYTTFGYTLLQGVVEAASGLGYEKYLQQHVFGPAGMTDSHLEYVDGSYPKRAVSYRKVVDEIVQVTFDDVSFKFAGGGMLSTPVDLVNLCVALWDGSILSAELVDEMFSEQFPELDRGNGYAWGIAIEEGTGLKRAWHPGRSNGFESYLLCYPEEKVAVSVLTNQHYTNPWDDVGGLAEFLARLYLPGGPSDAVQVPQATLASAVSSALESDGSAAALSVYREYLTGAAYRGRDTETEVNALGYRLLAAGRLDDATAVWELNAEVHPDGAKVHNSLGEGYMLLGETERAIGSYERTLALDPDNLQAVRMLEKLRSTAEPATFEPAGRYELSSEGGEGGEAFTITVELIHGADGSYEGTVVTSLSPEALSVLAVLMGGNRMWVTTVTPEGPFELEMGLQGLQVEGRWFYNGFSGGLSGDKVE